MEIEEGVEGEGIRVLRCGGAISGCVQRRTTARAFAKGFFIDAHISPYLSHLSSLFSRTSHLSSGLFHVSPFLVASLFLIYLVFLSYVSFLSLYLWVYE